MPSSSTVVTFFGKVPRAGDFVRHRAAGPPVKALDGWLQRGLVHARTVLGPAYGAAYAAAPPVAFLHRAGRDAVPLLGVLQPSRDRVGRRFPCFVAAVPAPPAPAPAAVPLRFATFVARAAALLREAAAGAVDPAELPDRADALAPSLATPGPAPGAQPLADFWTRLWGDPDDSRKYIVVKNLLSAHARAGGGGPALRFPLAPDGTQAGSDAAAWLALYARRYGAPAAFYWSLAPPAAGAAGGAGRRPFLIASGRAVPPEGLVHLLGATPPAAAPSAWLLDLEALTDANAALAALAIPDACGRLLEDDRSTLTDLIDAF